VRIVKALPAGLDLDEFGRAAARAAAAGFKAVEDAGEVHSPEDVPVDPSHWAARRLAASAAGIDIVSLRAVRVRPQRPDPADQAFVSEIQRLIDGAAEAGAAVVSLGPLADEALTAGAGRRPEFGLGAARAVRFDGERRGVRLAIVPGGGLAPSSPAECREWLDEVNAWWVGADLDLAALPASGPLEEWLGTLTHRVAVVRITAVDWTAKDWRRADEALAAARFEGPVVVHAMPPFANSGR